jgi:transcription antitermination protein NusB
MQVLYAETRDESFDKANIEREYHKRIDQSFELLLFCLYNLIQIAHTSLDDADKRKNKHLPSDLDKKFTPKLYENVLIKGLEGSKLVQSKFDQYHIAQRVDKDHIKTIYAEFLKEESYINYIQADTGLEETLEMLLELFRFCRRNELFNEILEDQFANWEDDKSLIIGAIKKIFKDLPTDNPSFIMDHYPDDETCKEYGEFLLKRTFSDDAALLSMIEPVLENWNAERVAVLDMIMIKMALSEFLHCKSVPVKVTLNEYVELAKGYSTSKSNEFINGVLDKLSVQLKESGKLVKEGRGLIDD